MKNFRLLCVVIITTIYLTGWLAVFYGLYTGDHGVIGLGFIVFMIPSQLIWGIIAGIMSHRCGWNGANRGSWDITNIICLFFIHGLLAPPVSMFQALRTFDRIGKFFPTPAEYTW